MIPISPLQLRDYFVETLHIDTNLDYAAPDANSFESKVGVEFGFKKRGEEPIFRIDLEVKVNPTDESFAQAPYRIEIKTQTVFEFEHSFPENEIPNLLGPNGLAMAYSIVRGIVGQATGSSLHGKFILPTLNFVDLLKTKIEDDKKKLKSPHK